MPLLRAVDAAEPDTLRVGVVQDFDRVAVEDGDDLAGEVSKRFYRCESKKETNSDLDSSFHRSGSTGGVETSRS